MWIAGFPRPLASDVHAGHDNLRAKRSKKKQLTAAKGPHSSANTTTVKFTVPWTANG